MKAAPLLAILILAATPAAAQQKAAEPYAELERSFREARSAFFKRYRKARTDSERRHLRAEEYPVPAFEKRFLELADKQRKRPAALKALAWILTVGQSPDARRRALERLHEDHASDPKLAEHLPLIADAEGGEETLRAIMNETSVSAIEGRARYLLAQILVRSRRELTVDREAEAVALLRRVIADHAELPAGEVSLGDRARGALFQITELRPGRPVPEITGPDLAGQQLSLRAAIKDSPALLLFWKSEDLRRADLTGRLAAIEKAYPGKLKVVGLSLDVPDDAREAARKAGLKWRSFLDEDGAIADRWGVFDGPQVLLIDARGQVSGRLSGLSGLRRRVARLLAD